MGERIRADLARLGLENALYATLLDEIVKWSISGQEVQRDDVLRVLGLLDHFVDRVRHNFPVDRSVWVPTPALFAALDASIGALDNGFVLVEGEPGIGKSTALTMYLADRSQVRFGYFCFVPNDHSIGNERLGEQSFVRSICIGLRNAFPELDFPNPYAPYTTRLLNEWLNALSRSKRRVIFVVDGVDQVDRKTRQSLVAQPLTCVLDGELPRNVVIVLSSRYPEALPSSIKEHVLSDPRRHIQMPPLDVAQVREFLRLRGVGLADALLDAVMTATGGVPIYLEYLAEHLGGMTRYEQERYLESVPTLRDKRIDTYHQHLWEGCSTDERIVYILAFLAARDAFTAPETLRELLHLVGVEASLKTVHDAVAAVRHALRISEAQSVAIRHSSLSEFVAERTQALREHINRAVLEWYSQHSDSDEAWRYQLRHLFEAGERAMILAACDDEWVSRAWARHRPIHELQANLNIAWQAASALRSVIDFVRIGLMKQRVALVSRSLQLSEPQFAQLLLDMGHPEEALRRVWDGERRQCGSVDFAQFCLSHLRSIGRLPPKHVGLAGLGDAPDPGVDVHATETWYRARCLFGDGTELLQAIERIRWQTKAQYGHTKQEFPEADNRETNLRLALAVIDQMLERGDFIALQGVRHSGLLEVPVRAAAQVCGVILARAGDIVEAKREVHGLDIEIFPELSRTRYLLELSEYGLDNALASFPVARPLLRDNLLNPGEQELSASPSDIYDKLRLLFLHDATGIPWFEATITGLREPVRTCIGGIGRLARLWTCWRRGKPFSLSALEELRTVMEDLDLPRKQLAHLDHRGDYSEHLYRRSVHRLYDHLWDCASSVLSEDEFDELARSWAQSDLGARAERYRDATLALAGKLHKRAGDRRAATVHDLIAVAERGAREDEETTVIAPALVACASAYGRCGFAGEAERLWSELLIIGCGVYWRKDYQLNEILTPMRLAHMQDAAGTLERVREQLRLAHQLVGAAQSKTVAIAIEGLIKFLATVDPRLALCALEEEEDLIFRDRAIRKVVLALSESEDIDHRLLLSVAATMSRWQNYAEFDEEANPAMFALFSRSIQRHDWASAGRMYELWRQVLLVEKEMPGELGRWAAKWVQAGHAPLDVVRDHAEYPAPPVEGTPGSGAAAPSAEDVQLAEELDQLAISDLAHLERRLDEALKEEIRSDRGRELERLRPEFIGALGRAAGREWSNDEERQVGECFNSFAEAAKGVAAEPSPTKKNEVRRLLQTLVDAVGTQLSCKLTLDVFGECFEIDEWLDGFIRNGVAVHSSQRKVEVRLPTWIASAPLSMVGAWEDFCRRRCMDETRAAGLVAAAERRASTAPELAILDLTEAWESISRFFHEHEILARHICSKLLELDKDKGCELLFESFRLEYERYPETIIYRLDRLLEFASKLPEFDAVHLYDIWAAHNRRLAAGLSEKLADLSWVTKPREGDFQAACLCYLTGLFNYPVVDVRLLSLDELFRLLRERGDLIEPLLQAWPRFDDGQKEHVATLLSSLGAADPASVQRWAPRLVALVQAEMHHNLRATATQAIELAESLGANVAPSILAEAQALRGPPRLVLPLPRIHVGPRGALQLPPYLHWAKTVLAASAARVVSRFWWKRSWRLPAGCCP